ncbi:MAG: hypothetical protein PHE88_00090 [Elusimicrobia bacterium]|nr:hypothetical protein [Elusimicrobiota bacterium]
MRVKTNKKTGFYFKIVGIVITLGSFYVWQRNASMILGYKISDVKDKISASSNENKYLKMKIMDIIALNNLEEVARKKLGLVTPKTSDIVIIEEVKEK